jgi:hypothetical protein
MQDTHGKSPAERRAAALAARDADRRATSAAR